LDDGREPQQFLLRSFLPLTNDEADAEPNTAYEEYGDDVRCQSGQSRKTYLLRDLVDRHRAQRHESDPQSPEDLRLLGHQMSKKRASTPLFP
jgi:hypothetical protein